jgi:hypothetical protein
MLRGLSQKGTVAGRGYHFASLVDTQRHTTAALVLEEGEGRERGMLKQLGHGQIGLQLCSDLL